MDWIEVFAPLSHDPSVEPLSPSLPTREKTRLDFDDVYREWFRHVVRWARALGGSSADLDDVAQEVFLVVQRKLVSFDGVNLGAWLFTITARTVSDQRRRGWFKKLFLRRDQDGLGKLRAVGDPSVELERKQRQEALYRILDRISDKRRTVFVLYEVEEYSGEQIAELLQIPLATVWTRLHHARKELSRLAAEECR
jgi:RNA polymerase sigma-70 factor (ECF subfamily)